MDKIKVTALQSFEFEGEKWFPGKTDHVVERVAKRWVSRGIAEYGDLNYILDKAVTKYPQVSIVVLVKDALKYVKKCFESIAKYTKNYELIIVDNDSNAQTKAYLKNIECLDYTLITNKENMGVSYGWNQGIKIAKHDYVCFVNSDCVVTPNWLDRLLAGFSHRKNVGAVGPTSCRTATAQSTQITRSQQHVESEKEILQFAKNLKIGFVETQVIGFCFVVDKKVFSKIGVFDWRRYGLAGHEDVDFIWRMLKAGFKSVWCTGSYVHHFGAKTTLGMGLDLHEIRSKNREVLEERTRDPNLYVKNDIKIEDIKKVEGNGSKKK